METHQLLSEVHIAASELRPLIFSNKIRIEGNERVAEGILLALLVSGEVLTKFTRNCDEMLTAVGRSLRLHHGDLRGDLLAVLILAI